MEKFCFVDSSFPVELSNKIWGLNFKDFGPLEGEVRYRIKNVNENLRTNLISFFKSLTKDSYILYTMSDFHFDINKMKIGEWVDMHNEVSQRCPFEVIVWLVKDSDFKGRDFIMKFPDVTKEIKPKNGLVCFLDTTDCEIYHGVSKLESDVEIISITGGLGRKENYGIS
jgi:hypothetical protein